MSCNDVDKIKDCMKRSAAVLRDNNISYALAGSLAVWARGGPPVTHDADFVVRAQDVDAALIAFERAGFRVERPPEEWLVKAFDEEGCMIDLIYRAPMGETSLYIENSEELVIESVRMPTMTIDDVLVMKLGAMNERYMDYVWALQAARSTREQITWDYLDQELKGSPFAEAFFVLCEGMGIRPTSRQEP